MIKIINRTTFNILSVIDSKLTQYSRDKYAIISDELIAEIRATDYEDGTYLNEEGIEVTNMVDLKIISNIVYLEVEDQAQALFDEVSTISYNDRQTSIDNYENNKINDTFKNYKYKLSGDLLSLLGSSISYIIDYCEAHPEIHTEKIKIGTDQVKVIAYLNVISETFEQVILDNSTLLTKEINITKE